VCVFQFKSKGQLSSTNEQEDRSVNSNSESEYEEEEDPIVQPTSVQNKACSATQIAIQKSKTSKGRSSRRQDFETVMSSLQNQQVENTRLQMQVKSLITPSQISAPQIWGSWIGTMAESFHPSVMERFYQESFHLVQKYSRESIGCNVPISSQPVRSHQQEPGPVPTHPTPPHAMQTPRSFVVSDINQANDALLPPNTSSHRQTVDMNIWDTPTPTAGLPTACPVQTPDVMTSSLQMSGLNSLVYPSSGSQYQSLTTNLNTPLLDCINNN